jgi:hypothetical protein
MKYKLLIIFAIAGFVLFSCTKSPSWSENYDIKFPVPVVSSVSSTRASVDDTLILGGVFNRVTSVTIGGGFATIDSVTVDSTKMFVIITETCASGPLVVKNVYNKFASYNNDIFIEGGGATIFQEEVVILDFTSGGALPDWTPSSWTEAKDFEETGYDLNTIDPPVGYDHYYAMNDTNLYPPSEPAGQGGNIPYGNYTSNNNGAGFDISFYVDPYVSVLINTGNDIAYLSLVLDGDINDFQPSNSPGGTFANGETKHYMQTNNRWMWYTFSLSDMMGGLAPATIESAGLFIRNSWDYGADTYPGFQLNIAKMVITEGPLPKTISVFNFEDGEPGTTTEVTGWASDALASWGLDLFDQTAPEGNHYYSMENHNSGGDKNYKFAVKADNDGEGFDLSTMKDPYISYAINTGSYSGFLDLVFYQEASGNVAGEPWADPGNGDSNLELYPEIGVGSFYDTGGLWEWRSYNLNKLLNSVPDWGKKDGLYPNFNGIFDYILLWPRDGWNNSTAAEPFEMNIDNVIITDGIPTKAVLTDLNK